MSTYIYLRSSECKDVYPKNHGGNFTIELNEPLRLDGGVWEVALAEMTYYAQAFPNLPPEYNEIKVTRTERLDDVYHTMNLDFSIHTWVLYNGDWHHSDYGELDKETHVPFISHLPKKNYDWEDFKSAMQSVMKKQIADKPQLSTAITFSFTENELACTFVSTMRTCIRFSKDLQNFLQLKVTDVYQGEGKSTDTQTISYVKPVLPKETLVLWEEYMYNELWVKLNDIKINIDTKNNTLRTFCDSLSNLTKGTKFEEILSFNSTVHNRLDKKWICLEYKFLKEAAQPISLQFSTELQQVFNVKDTILTFEGADKDYVEIHAQTYKVILSIPVAPMSKKLSYNYYPSPKTLIDEINSIIKECTSTMNSKPEELFKLDENAYCIFTNHPKYRIEIKPFLMNMLHLSNTNTTHKGSASISMSTAVREFLHVHTDLLESNNFNGSDVIRVINNDRAPDENVMISFPNLYYYPIRTRYLYNIQFRITDSRSDDDLPFSLEVTYLLHFRKCNNLPFS